MKKIAFGACVAAVAASAALADDAVVTNTLIGIASGSSNATLYTGDYWKLGYGDSAMDYLVDGYSFRMPAPGPGKVQKMKGHSWTFGTLGGTSYEWYIRQGAVSYPNDGVFLVHGTWLTWWDTGDRERTVIGHVTVSSPSSAPFCFSHNSGCTNVCYVISNAVACAAGNALEFKHKGNNVCPCGLQFCGDLSAYSGALSVTSPGCWLGFRKSATTFPGTLTYGAASTELRLDGANPLYTFGSLTLHAGTTLVPTLSVIGRKVSAPVLRVTDAFSFTSPIAVSLEGDSNGTNDLSHIELMRLPAGTSLSESDIALDVSKMSNTVFGNEFAVGVETDPGTGEKVVYVSRARNIAWSVVTMTTSHTSYSLMGEVWSDGRVPNGNTDYYANLVVRTKASAATDVFPGHSLTLASTLVLQSKDVTVSNMLIRSGASLANWHANGNTATNTFAAGGTKILRGNISMCDNLSVTQNGNGNYLDIAAQIEDDGVHTVTIGVNDGVLTSWCEFSGDNPSWRSVMRVAPVLGTSRPEANPTNTAVLVVKRPHQLGGPLPSFYSDALHLSNGAVLWAPNDLTLDDATRGVCIGDKGAGIQVSDGATLNLKEMVNMRGPLTKIGGGTLALGGGLTYDSTFSSSPVDGMDELVVREGAIKALAAGAFDGFEITMSERAVLKIDPPSALPAAISATGLVNVRTDTPFILADGTLRVVLDVPFGPAPSEESFTVPICTVTGTAAATLRNHIDVACPYKHMIATVSESADDGNVTFFATFRFGGMTIIMR